MAFSSDPNYPSSYDPQVIFLKQNLNTETGGGFILVPQILKRTRHIL
jgi:hypothetical protein